MTAIRLIAEVVGWIVLALWLVGALNWADFSLKFGPHQRELQRPMDGSPMDGSRPMDGSPTTAEQLRAEWRKPGGLMDGPFI